MINVCVSESGTRQRWPLQTQSLMFGNEPERVAPLRWTEQLLEVGNSGRKESGWSSPQVVQTTAGPVTSGLLKCDLEKKKIGRRLKLLSHRLRSNSSKGDL